MKNLARTKFMAKIAPFRSLIVFLMNMVLLGCFRAKPIPKIVESRVFTCSHLESGFEYPVFEGFEDIEQVDCSLRVKDGAQSGYTLATVDVRIGKGALFTLDDTTRNTHGVAYRLTQSSSRCEMHFMLGDRAGQGDVVVTMTLLPMRTEPMLAMLLRSFCDSVLRDFGKKR